MFRNLIFGNSFNRVTKSKTTQPVLWKLFSNQQSSEEKLKQILNFAFPKAKSVEVLDVSGGCGAMFEIHVEAPQFKGLSIVKQHQLVTNALKEEIKDMHGLRIQTTPT